MTWDKEIDFENHIRKILSNTTLCAKSNFTLLDSKNVADIIICRNINIPKVFFIEVKYYSPQNRAGGVGFGNSAGLGFQSEILKKRPIYFEDNLIWVFGQKDKYDNNYYILRNEDCSKYIMGREIGKKQNNFQRRLFDDIMPMNENNFLRWIENWLTN